MKLTELATNSNLSTDDLIYCVDDPSGTPQSRKATIAAVLGLSYSTANTWTALQTFTAGSASTKGLVVKGAASQTANLQEWQNSSGTVLASIDSSGKCGIGTSSPNNLLHLLSVGGSQLRVAYDGTNYLTVGVSDNVGTTTFAFSGNNPSLAFTGASSYSFNTSVSINGLVKTTSPSNSDVLQVYNTSQNRGWSLYSALWDLQVREYTTPFTTSNVRMTFGGLGAGTISTNAQFIAQTDIASKVSLIAKGVASQTANLQEWQNSSGTVLSYVNNAGAAVWRGTCTASRDSDGSTTQYATLTNNSSGQTIAAGSATGGVSFGMESGTTPSLWAKRGGSGSYTGFRLNTNNLVAGMTNTDNSIVSYTGDATAYLGDPSCRWLSFYSAQGQFIGSAAGTIPLIVKAAASQSANLQEWQKSDGTVYATITENGYTTTRNNSAPADAELAAGEAAYWFDSTNGAARFMIKAKQANGTVVTGSVSLT